MMQVITAFAVIEYVQRTESRKEFRRQKETGMLKALLRTDDNIFTTKLHLPAVAVILLMATEFLGSLCLIGGFFTRVFDFAIGFSLSVCALMNHVQNGFFMNWFVNQKSEGFEFDILAAGIALALAVKGCGAFSIDNMISKK